MSPAGKVITAMFVSWFGLAGSCLADEKCALVRVTSLDMRTDETGRVYVPISIAGKSANLTVDTGAVLSTLTQSTVDAFALSTSAIPHTMKVVIFGGTQITRYTTARDISFGGMKAPQMDFLVMPDGLVPPSINGLLAPGALRAYDYDFDFANARLSLFEPHTCPGDPVYWTHDPHAEIPLQIDHSGHIQVNVSLDGVEIPAEIDTGSSRSSLGLEYAQDIFEFGTKRSSGESSESNESARANRHSFKSLVFGQSSSEFGTVTVVNPDLPLVPKSTSKLPDMPNSVSLILGMGILRQLHLYIAYKEKKLYVTAASAH